MTPISITAYHAIVRDIENGEYTHDGRTTGEYYDDERNRHIVISTLNDGFELVSLEVEITDEENNNFELEADLWRHLQFKAERALEDARKEAESEAEYIKYLWKACV